MAYDKNLAARVRGCLSDASELREQAMMGALCFMVGGHICCGVTGVALMVRVGRDTYDAALAEDHVRPMEISGRKPRGFVLVDPPGIISDQALDRWIARGREFVSTLALRAINI